MEHSGKRQQVIKTIGHGRGIAKSTQHAQLTFQSQPIGRGTMMGRLLLTAPKPLQPAQQPVVPSVRKLPQTVINTAGKSTPCVRRGLVASLSLTTRDKILFATNKGKPSESVLGDKPSEPIAHGNKPSESVARDNKPSESVARDNKPSEYVARDYKPYSVARDNKPSESVSRDKKPSEYVARDKKSSDSVAKVSKPMHAIQPDHPDKTRSTETTSRREYTSTLQRMLKKMALDTMEPEKKRGNYGQKVPVSANYIAVKCHNVGVFQYHVTFQPTIESIHMRGKLLLQHTDVTGHVRAFDGQILFLPIELPEKEMVLSSARLTDNATVIIKIRSVCRLAPEQCCPLYNIIFHNVMKILTMCRIDRHYYDPMATIKVPQHKLEVWPGYVTACERYFGGLMIMTDVSHKVLRSDTVLDVMDNIRLSNPRNFAAEVERHLLGAVVLTRYNNKTYRIDDIAWDQKPTDKFDAFCGHQQTYMEYYKISHNQTIQDDSQPLLIHRVRRQHMNMPREKHQLEVIHLIPELCRMTGLTDTLRKDFRVMKDLASHTRVNPMARVLALKKFILSVNSNEKARAELMKWGLELDPKQIDLEGRLLTPETIFWGHNHQVDSGPEADWGRSIGKAEVLRPIRTTLSALNLWRDPSGVAALLDDWREKLAANPPKATEADSPQ